MNEEFELPKNGEHELRDDSILMPDRPPFRFIDKYIQPECPFLTKRTTVALLTCIGFIVISGMQCSISLTKLKFEKITNNSLKFYMDFPMFGGYLVSQAPAGYLATKYPTNILFGGAIGISSVLNILYPSAFMFGPAFTFIITALQGIAKGVAITACYGIWRYWAPPLERTRLATLALCGCSAGLMFGMPLCGELIERINWQAPFYFYGCFGIVWYLIWLWLVFEKPSKHPTIDLREQTYIDSSLGDFIPNHRKTTITNIPWKAFFTSLPVWAIFIANFCRSWNIFMFIQYLPTYMSDMYMLEIEENGVLGIFPHFLMTIAIPSSGLLADYLRKQGILTTTQVRKVFNCGGFAMEATLLLILAFSKKASQAMVAYFFIVAFRGFAISGFNINQLDIAPNYASILVGMSNVIGVGAGFLCELAVYGFTNGIQTIASWRHVFLLGAAIHSFGAIFYGIFASGELQPWAGKCNEEQSQADLRNRTVEKKKLPTILILSVIFVVCLLSLLFTLSFSFRLW